MCMNILGTVGRSVRLWISRWLRVLSVAACAVFHALFPKTWRAPTRNVLARQILFTGFEATHFVGLIAAMVGILLVVQAQYWLTRLGQSGLIGPILTTVLIRELAPLLTNFVVVARSGPAIATELANMKVNGELRTLDAMGIDPFLYLVIPRVIGVGISAFCLTIIFTAVSLLVGFIFIWVISSGAVRVDHFFGQIIGALQMDDVIALVIKAIVPGLMTGAICCDEGFSVEGAVTEVPIAATRGVVRAISCLFVLSVFISMVLYL